MRSLVCALALIVGASSAVAETRFPINLVNDGQQAGIFSNRNQSGRRLRPSPPPQGEVPAPEGRTTPVDPNAAPQFQAAPADGSALSTAAEITPEQKQALFQAIVAFVSALIGAFAGSGGASPLLTALLNAFKGIQLQAPAPAPAPAKTRTRRAPAKPKAVSSTPTT